MCLETVHAPISIKLAQEKFTLKQLVFVVDFLL